MPLKFLPKYVCREEYFTTLKRIMECPVVRDVTLSFDSPGGMVGGLGKGEMFNHMGTVTGRIRSDVPNLGEIERPSSDPVIIGMDYSEAESRVFQLMETHMECGIIVVAHAEPLCSADIIKALKEAEVLAVSIEEISNLSSILIASHPIEDYKPHFVEKKGRRSGQNTKPFYPKSRRSG